MLLTSKLLNQKHFIHGLNYYGSFIGIKHDLKLNVFDDLEHLHNSEFFQKHKGHLYDIEDYSNILCEEPKLEPIKIDYESTLSTESLLENMENIENIDNMFGDVFIDNNDVNKESTNEPMDASLLECLNSAHDNDNKSLSLKSNSTCSSRVSNTSGEYSDIEEDENLEIANTDINNENIIQQNGQEQPDDISVGSNDSDNSGDYSDDEEDDEEEVLEASIKNFPINLICMEHCENTLDNLIMDNELSNDEWHAALMQVIMMLLTYQTLFSFTHNDLHTNNIMFNKTDKKYLLYQYKNLVYKVPTYGRIFKIIDFGRSIYKCNNMLFCSDSFQSGEDAATQYNTEPFFNPKKSRLDPNYSFDLCRLACSIFDYIIDDIQEVKDLSQCSPIQKLIAEWCLDDRGINILYKQNGEERYPDFKLYKMIARHVHKHTPEAQLSRPCFKKYLFNGNAQKEIIMDIDKIESEYKI